MHKNDIYRITSDSFMLTQSFHDKVLEVLRRCDVSFQLLGYQVPVMTLTLEELPQDSPLKRLGQQSNELQRSTSVRGPDALLQITKIIVSLVANRSLTLLREETFADLIEMLQEVDPLERFLQLIANNDLYWLLMTLLKIKSPAMEIFAGRALDCAFGLGDRRLVQTLLEVEADPYDCNLLQLFDPEYLEEKSHHNCDLVRDVLKAQLERDRSVFKHKWEIIILQGAGSGNFKWLFTLVLKSLVHFIKPTSQEECLVIIEAMIADNHQAFMDRSQSLIASCKEDHTYSIILQGICKIAPPKVATEALKLLRETGSPAFEISLFHNLVGQSYLWDEKYVLFLLNLSPVVSFTAKLLRSFVSIAVRRDWLQVAEFFIAHGM